MANQYNTAEINGFTRSRLAAATSRATSGSGPLRDAPLPFEPARFAFFELPLSSPPQALGPSPETPPVPSASTRYASSSQPMAWPHLRGARGVLAPASESACPRTRTPRAAGSRETAGTRSGRSVATLVKKTNVGGATPVCAAYRIRTCRRPGTRRRMLGRDSLDELVQLGRLHPLPPRRRDPVDRLEQLRRPLAGHRRDVQHRRVVEELQLPPQLLVERLRRSRVRGPSSGPTCWRR